MSYLEDKINKRLEEMTNLKDKEVVEIFRDKIHLYVSVQEKTNPIEAAMELGIINSITYKDKKYPLRTLVISLPEEADKHTDEDHLHEYLIASEDLFNAFGEEMDDWDEAAHSIDQQVYYYVEPESFLLDGKEMAEDCLDEKFSFHYECGALFDTCEYCGAVCDEKECECDEAQAGGFNN
jgi:hypothetical protein